MTRVLLLATNDELTRSVQSLPGHQVALMDSERVTALLAESGGLEGLVGGTAVDVPELVVIGEGIEPGEALSLAGALDAAYPSMEIVLVAEPDAELVLFAMRAGIRDIVAPTIEQDELKALIHRVGENVRVRSAPKPAAAGSDVDLSRVIVVTSPRGGTGKSTVATNLAVALAKDAPRNVVLVDLDLQFGDAGSILNITPVHSIADAFESTAALDTLILKTFLTVHSSDAYVLCGPESPTVSDKVTPDQITHLIGQLSSQFRYIVVDTTSGLNETTLAAIETASDLVLVSTMDLANARAMRKEIALLSQFDLIPASSHIVLNFADRHSGIGVREIEAELGLPIDISVPRSKEVLYAGNLGEPVMSRKKSGPVGKSIRQLVKRIHADEEAENRNKHRGIDVA